MCVLVRGVARLVACICLGQDVDVSVELLNRVRAVPEGYRVSGGVWPLEIGLCVGAKVLATRSFGLASARAGSMPHSREGVICAGSA